MHHSGPDDVLASLDALFDAAIAREEEAAATDLAVTLFQDRPLADVLARGGPWDVLLDGARLPLERVGRDFVAARRYLIPLARVIVAPTRAGAPPVAHPGGLLEVLRRLARARVEVRVRTALDGGDRLPLPGVLTACGRDFVALATRVEERLLALDAIEWVEVAEGRTGVA